MEMTGESDDRYLLYTVRLEQRAARIEGFRVTTARAPAKVSGPKLRLDFDGFQTLGLMVFKRCLILSQKHSAPGPLFSRDFAAAGLRSNTVYTSPRSNSVYNYTSIRIF